MLVIAMVIAFLLVGVVGTLIAAGKGQRLGPWSLYGLSLPMAALPHALGLRRAAAAPDPADGSPRTPRLVARLGEATALEPAALWVVLVLGVTNAVLVNWNRVLFGPLWRHAMWEGGALETLTFLNFIGGAAVFVMAALATPERRRRFWLGLFAVAGLALAGEEAQWFQGQFLLDLGDPDFATRYNPAHTALHSAVPGLVPILVFFLVVAGLRLLYRPVVRWTGLPVALGFLNATLLTAVAVLFMRFDHDRYLLVDEVYEWSGSVLILYLAMHSRWGWFFRR